MESEEKTLKRLLHTYYPGFKGEWDESLGKRTPTESGRKHWDWQLATKVLFSEKVEWVIRTIGPFNILGVMAYTRPSYRKD